MRIASSFIDAASSVRDWRAVTRRMGYLHLRANKSELGDCRGYAGEMASEFGDSYLGRLRARVGHELLLSPGVQIVVLDSVGRVLIQRRTDNGVWELPAGSCEPGQSFRTAAVAELSEETGIDVDAADLTPFASFSDPVEHLLSYPNGDQVHAFAMCFLVASPDVPVSGRDGEATAHRWVLPDSLPEPVHSPSRNVLALLREFQRTGAFQAA